MRLLPFPNKTRSIPLPVMNSHFHFLGICGTAMGAVAAAMVRRGFTVTGSDANVYPPMSTFLEEEGITLFEGYKASNIPPDADVIVIGNAMSRGNEESARARSRRRTMPLAISVTMPDSRRVRWLPGV